VLLTGPGVCRFQTRYVAQSTSCSCRGYFSVDVYQALRRARGAEEPRYASTARERLNKSTDHALGR